jgi:pentatricopeptide repeat protein
MKLDSCFGCSSSTYYMNIAVLSHILRAVMNAWIRSGELRGAERILEEMERCFYQGKSDIVPNVVSYTTLMNG